MDKLIFNFILFTILLGSCSTDQAKTNDYTAITGATLFDGTGQTVENAVILIKDGRIEAVGNQELTIPKGTETIDASGKYITPGLIDSHVHFAQTGFFDGRPDVVDLRDSLDYDELQKELRDNPEPYYEAYLRSGVTAVYDVGGFLWSIERQTTAEDNLNAPHVAASGPLLSGYPESRLDFFNTLDAKQMVFLASPEKGRASVRQHSDLGSTGIKIWGLRLDDPNFLKGLDAVAEETVAQGNKLIVHATFLDQAKKAIEVGAKVLVHSVQDQEVDDAFLKMAKENRAIYLPTLIVGRGYLETYKSLLTLREIDDPNQLMDSRAKAFLQTSTQFSKFLSPDFDLAARIERSEQSVNNREATMAINLKKVYDAGITIAVATDAGNPGTFHGISIYEEMEAMQNAGIPAIDLIQMATQNGATAMERLDDFGTLEKGKMADLIILAQNPALDISNMRSITHVMRGGVLRPVDVPFKK